ncbi:hypothetical protein [Nesterenkonia sphaerica]|uniref:DedA family protein n=1 Tax=Nesterenkonia sphaerica TaxID=1804988 RepID=A0A5R9A3S1_9MICC|nr:hypothetical protein [Nesterenkonia sphaerica]TLP73258.1 hypothetical protein FEF27_10140 [Nesterenkonia sphaerica]
MGRLRRRNTSGAVRDHSVAAVWGFAEATFFFVVPDVWTSWLGLRRPRRGLSTACSALGGALLGGAVTWRWARSVSAESSRAALIRVPAISAGMVEHVEQEVTASGHRALLRGPTRGVPYKLYARASGLQHKSLLNFLAWSVPGRLIRFMTVTLLTAGIARLIRMAFPQVPERDISAVFWAGWGGFYAWFITVMSRRR